MRFIDHDPDTGQCSLNQTELPVLQEGEVLCRVSAFGINRADLLQKQGKYPPPSGVTSMLGMELSGIVAEVADESLEYLVGSPVCAMVAGGGYAEFVKFPASHIIPIVGNIASETTVHDTEIINKYAAVPEVFLTAFQALFTIAGLRAGEKVLIHAGASGVGTAAIQLAKRASAQIACTTSSDVKNAACLQLGADLVINYRQHEFDDVLKQQQFFPDVIIDFVGNQYLQKNLSVAAMDCRIVQLAMLGGRYVESVDMAKMLAKRICWQASTLRNRSEQYKTTLVAEFLARFGTDLQTGIIHPVIDRIYQVQQINEAHQYMAENRNIGKLIVTW